MGAIVGYGGQVDWGLIIDSDANYQAGGWNVDVTADALDVTVFNTTGYRSFLAGLKSWSGSVDLKVDETIHMQVSDVGASATIRLYMSDASLLKGTAICTGWHPAVAVEGEQTQTMDFQGTGALTNSDV